MTREDETSDPSRFFYKSRANTEIRFTGVETDAWKRYGPGKEVVLAASGRASEKCDFFNSLLQCKAEYADIQTMTGADLPTESQGSPFFQ